MCNYMHKATTTEPIPSYGLGWKIFSAGPTEEEYRQLIYSDVDYDVDDDGWVNWDVFKAGNMTRAWEYEGFCFFRDLKTARFAKNRFDEETGRKTIIRQIKYIGGIGSCIEDLFIPEPIRIEFCKSFRVLPEDKEDREKILKQGVVEWK